MIILKYCKIYLILDPACQNINRKQQCYVMDPSCPNQVSDDKTNNNDAIIYTCGVLGGLLVLSVAVLLFFLLKRIRRKCSGIKWFISFP